MHLIDRLRSTLRDWTRLWTTHRYMEYRQAETRLTPEQVAEVGKVMDAMDEAMRQIDRTFKAARR